MKTVPSVDIALPVYYGNVPELEQNVRTLVQYCSRNLQDYKWTVVIAINGKQPEQIIALAKKLRRMYKKKVTYSYTEKPGKGHGVIEAWSKRNADIHTYMDIDLSTDLSSFRVLLEGIKEGYEIVVGSRYHKQSEIRRSLKRYIISRGYIIFLYRAILQVPVNDSQCGFKAVTPRVAQEILPLIKDRIWFWESEMLYIAHKKGFAIKEIPVIWTEKKVSGVNLIKIIPNFIKNVIRMRFTRIK